jgi:hypothetical protein
MEAWWTAQTAAWIGAIGGGGLGILGATLGVVGGKLAPRGKGKGFVLGTMTAIVILGTGALIAGIVALIQKQPYHVWYPLALEGGISVFVFGFLMPVMRMRYRQAEQRRIDAESLRRG